MDKKLEQEFDEVIHNSEVFDVLDIPHEGEDTIPLNMDKEQVEKYLNSFKK